DHIEGELKQLTHQRDLVQQGVISNGQTLKSMDIPAGSTTNEDSRPINSMVDKENAFALEMQIQLKRAEREKKLSYCSELEVDFRQLCCEVENKRHELDRLGIAIVEVEATRLRKTREFQRMQTNLMELLREQKTELDAVREKGVQLEVATAMTAAASTATAQRAKEHEQRTSAMYSQTEELMKFQFMSMSLGYFSSLNMLKQMRDINADTTTAAVTSSADAAAAAAAAAAASNLPTIKARKSLEGELEVISSEV
ncbi:unnamed protein product, partial [Choristocarpus tenellus]